MVVNADHVFHDGLAEPQTWSKGRPPRRLKSACKIASSAELNPPVEFFPRVFVFYLKMFLMESLVAARAPRFWSTFIDALVSS
jgi:hypothetical protein